MNTSDALVAKLAPYRERPGVKAALLVSHDGFLVATSADPDIDAEAIAAHLGGTIDIGARLADGSASTRRASSPSSSTPCESCSRPSATSCCSA